MIRIANYLKRWLTFCAIDFREPSIRSKLDSFINSLPNISTLDNDDITNSYMIYKDLIFLQKLFNKFIDEVVRICYQYLYYIYFFLFLFIIKINILKLLKIIHLYM